MESYFVVAGAYYLADHDGDGVFTPVDANGNPIFLDPVGPVSGPAWVGGPIIRPDWLHNLNTWAISQGAGPAFGPTDTDGDGYHDGIDRDDYDPYYA